MVWPTDVLNGQFTGEQAVYFTKAVLCFCALEVMRNLLGQGQLDFSWIHRAKKCLLGNLMLFAEALFGL